MKRVGPWRPASACGTQRASGRFRGQRRRHSGRWREPSGLGVASSEQVVPIASESRKLTKYRDHERRPPARVGKTSAIRPVRGCGAAVSPPRSRRGQQGRQGRNGCDLRQYGSRACTMASRGRRSTLRSIDPLRGVDVTGAATQSSARPERRSAGRRPRGRLDRFANGTQVARDARRLGHHRHETKLTAAVGARENIERKRSLQELGPRPIASSDPRGRRVVDARLARGGSRRLRASARFVGAACSPKPEHRRTARCAAVAEAPPRTSASGARAGPDRSRSSHPRRPSSARCAPGRRAHA